jgi:hypothetical protein
VLSERDLVPAIWLPDPSIRREREVRVDECRRDELVRCTTSIPPAAIWSGVSQSTTNRITRRRR